MTDPNSALAAQFGGVPISTPAAPMAAAPAGDDTLARQFGGVPVGSADRAPDFKQSDTSPNDVDPNTLGTFLRHVWDGVNPLNIGQLLPWPKVLGGSGVDNPLNPAKILAQAEALRQEGNTAWEKGDKTRAVAKYLDSILPILGPIASHAADQLERGKIAAGAGDIAAVVGPAALGALPTRGGAAVAAPVGGGGGGLTAAEAASNAFGEAHGVPLDAATATGNPFVRGVQKTAGESMIGAIPGSRGRAAQASALSRVGGELADTVHPVPVTPEQAGAGSAGSIRSAIASVKQAANRAYDTVRAEEAKPENLDTVPLKPAPVDALKDWQRGELRRIVHEMDASGYTDATWNDLGEQSGVKDGNAGGGQYERVPRSGGAKVYHDITERLGHESLDRGEIQEQLEGYLGGGKETAAVKAALDVAKARQMGSRKISTPEMPVSAFTVPTKLEAARQTSAEIPMAVDLTSAKAAVQPMYEALRQEADMAPLMGGKADALRALARLVNGPDHAPLSVADGALSDLKTMARSDDPLLRSAGQGKAAKAAEALGEAINLRAAGAGDTTYDALQAGRDATRRKYALADVLKGLESGTNGEPVKMFKKLTAPKDSAIEQLRAVADAAPDALPQLGRAKLEEWLETATERDRFDHADKLYAEWQKLGPETKKLLFGKTSTIEGLDRFFLLAKRIGENPNPSMTAPTLLKAGEMSGMMTHPLYTLPASLSMGALAKIMYSPAGVRALTKLLQADPRAVVGGAGRTIGRAAVQVAWTDLAVAAKGQGVDLPATPAAAQRNER